MTSFHKSMQKFRAGLEAGYLQEAYSGLMGYMRGLRLHFEKKFPNFSVPSKIYYGFMDMTYFAISTPVTKPHKLKFGVLFEYTNFQFEIYLSGFNRKVGAKYWRIIQEKNWTGYTLAEDPKKVDFIVYNVLAADPDFADLDALTAKIEKGTLDFIDQSEGFLKSLSA